MTTAWVAVVAALGGAMLALTALKLNGRRHARSDAGTPADQRERAGRFRPGRRRATQPRRSRRLSPRRGPRLAGVRRLLGRRGRAVLTADRSTMRARVVDAQVTDGQRYRDARTAPETLSEVHPRAGGHPGDQPARTTTPTSARPPLPERPAGEDIDRTVDEHAIGGGGTADRGGGLPGPALALPPGSPEQPATGAPTGPIPLRGTRPGEDGIERPPRQATARSGRRAWLWYEPTGAELLLPPGHVTIGRSARNSVRIDHPSVSRRHVSLRYRNSTWWLLPEVTSNGTYVNGHIIPPGQEAPLTSEDRLQLGSDVEVTFFAPVDETLQFHAAARTTPGSRRVNEDAFLATRHTLAVADGVAGRPAGRIASRMAIDVVHSCTADRDLEAVVDAAHAEIVSRAARTPAWAGMSTTLDVIRLEPSDGWMVVGAHVGDGLVLLQQGDQPWLMTASDRVGDLLARQDPERARHLRGTPEYDRLAAGLGFRSAPTPQLWSAPAQAGQRLLVASDGLLTALPMEEVLELLQDHRSNTPEQVVELLLSASTTAPDNVTVVIADIEDVGIDATAEDDQSTSDTGPLPLPADLDTTG